MESMTTLSLPPWGPGNFFHLEDLCPRAQTLSKVAPVCILAPWVFFRLYQASCFVCLYLSVSLPCPLPALMVSSYWNQRGISVTQAFPIALFQHPLLLTLRAFHVLFGTDRKPFHCFATWILTLMKEMLHLITGPLKSAAPLPSEQTRQRIILTNSRSSSSTQLSGQAAQRSPIQANASAFFLCCVLAIMIQSHITFMLSSGQRISPYHSLMQAPAFWLFMG